MTINAFKYTILVVDDQEDFAEGIAEVLVINGYNAKPAHDPESALDLLEKYDFALALVDLRLGNTNGMDLVGSLKARKQGIECLIMTAYADVDTAVEAVRRGAYDYLRKPIDTEDLLATLKRCFEKIRLEEEKRAAEEALRSKNRELKEINKRLREVVSSTKDLAACAYHEGFGAILLKEFARNMVAQGGSIYMINEEGLGLIHSLDGGHAPESIPFPLKKGSILNAALESKEPFLVTDLSQRDDLEASGWTGYSDGSVIVFPLVDDNLEMLGIISLHNKLLPPFTEQDKEFGALLANHSCEAMRALKAVSALKKRELAYSNLFNNLLDIFFRTDLQGNILKVSPSFERILGYSLREAVSLNIAQDLFSNLKEGRHFISQANTKGKTELYEAAFKHRDGSEKWLSINACLSKDSNGKAYGIEGIARDISEMVFARDELSHLAAAIDQTAELIFITDTKGNFQYVNPSFEHVTGYSREEVLGKNVRLLKSGKQRESLYSELWKTISRGDVWRGKLINKRKDGSLYHEEATITPIRNGSGRIVNYVAVKRDVTKISMLESQLRQAQKTEAIGTLAGGIAHDFNNILSSIMGYSELAILDAPEGAHCAKHLQKVLRASHRAKELVNQILTFSRKEDQELVPLDLKVIIQDTLKLMRASLPSTIDIRRDIAAEERIILADLTQIHQVIMNICTNARDAMRKDGGVLEVRLEEAVADTESSLAFPDLNLENHLMLTIRDTGHGMSQETVERIFDPYFTTKEKGEGTGLGLAIVQTIIQRHDGHIRVRSEPGKGTSFYIYLPHADRDNQAIQAEDESKKIAGGRERILVVDDEQDIVMIVKNMLTRLGYRVVTFNKSKEALASFRSNPDAFDAVISDVTMPEMTGEVLTTHIKENEA